MKVKETIAVILIILATVGTVVGVIGIEKYRRSKLYTVELTARTTEHGNWYPKRIKVPVGSEARILIRNIDTVSHGFALPDFNVMVKEIKAGNVAVVRLRPDKKGVFPFMCTVWCSDRHLEMTGELVVE